MEFPNYDEEIRSIIPYYDSLHEMAINIVKAVNLKPKVWLDTGCGTGSMVDQALKHFPNTKFILADPSTEMLEKAKKKLSGSHRVTFLKPIAAQDLPTESIRSHDIITAILSHHIYRWRTGSRSLKYAMIY